MSCGDNTEPQKVLYTFTAIQTQTIYVPQNSHVQSYGLRAKYNDSMCSSKIKQAKGKTHKSELAVLQWRRPGLPFKTTASIKLPTQLKRRKRANFFQLQLFETSKASRQPSISVTEGEILLSVLYASGQHTTRVRRYRNIIWLTYIITKNLNKTKN